MEHLISIVIPVYNTHQYLEECIYSVYNQTYANIEVIVVDDGSNQKTKNKLQELSPKIDLIVTQKNKGQATARNVGINKAKGDFILFIDSDDYINKEYCKEVIASYSKDISVITTYANIIIKNEPIKVFKPIGGSLKKSLFHNIALGTSFFLRTDLVAIGGYDEEMKTGFEDWEMLIRLLEYSKKSVFVVEKPLYNYRKGIISTTIKANKVKYDLLKYIYNKHENLYKFFFKEFISFLLEKNENEEKEKLKVYTHLDYKLGNFILKPLRFIKRIIND